MLALIRSLLDLLTAFTQVLRPLSNFLLSLLGLANLMVGWLRPLAGLLEALMAFLRALGL
ncbi:MAG: hypothetical protein FWE98_02670 [Oscillospiraceae bacterium]|nr:hypothetical protein [Oscillospiraceae bacterium]